MNRRLLFTWLAAPALLAAAAGCGKKQPRAVPLKPGARVLALGDSLTFGMGATPQEAWPARLAALSGWTVANAGVNGDTSAGALRRLDALLAADPFDAVLLGIGGNDMLRGVAAADTSINITEILRRARGQTSHLALLATPAPTLLRAAAGRLADAPFYATVAAAEKVLLIDGVYAQVLSDATLRSDQIHANAKGYDTIAQQVFERLRKAGW